MVYDPGHYRLHKKKNKDILIGLILAQYCPYQAWI